MKSSAHSHAVRFLDAPALLHLYVSPKFAENTGPLWDKSNSRLKFVNFCHVTTRETKCNAINRHFLTVSNSLADDGVIIGDLLHGLSPFGTDFFPAEFFAQKSFDFRPRFLHGFNVRRQQLLNDE